MIEIQGITKSYRDKQVLGPIDLTIAPGGVTALVGPNGAGKSTLLTIAGRLLEPTSGTVHIDGADVRKTKAAELAKTVSILRQENHFVARLTVRQLVELGRFPHSRGRLTEEDMASVDHAIEFLDLGHLENRFIDEMSGGQRQRAYVAMVIAQDTRYVLLDEPLNNLDIGHAVEMMTRVRQAADEFGKAFVVVLHDINFASAYADRIVGLSDGEIRFDGTPEEVMDQQTLSATFGATFSVRKGSGYALADYYRVQH